MIRVEFETTAEDYRRVLLWYHWKRLLLGAFVYLLVVGSALVMLSYDVGGVQVAISPAMGTFVLFLLPLFLALNGYLTVWYQASKIAEVTEPASATFLDSGITLQTPSSSSESAWRRFHRVYETKTDFIFFPLEKIFYMIPKRYFADEVELRKVRGILRAALGNNAKLKD